MDPGRTQRKAGVHSILIIALMTTAISLPGMTQTSPVLNKKDIIALLRSATTAEDHQELAAYYRERASHFIANSQQFTKQAEFMDTQSKRGTSCSCAAPYRYIANEYANKARQAEQSAAQQERLARGSRPTTGPRR